MSLSTPQNDIDNSGIPLISVANSFIPATQSGVWSVGRTWVLSNATDTIGSVQSGSWSVGRTWALASGTDSVAAIQSGTWTTGRTWTLASGTDSIAAVQSGTWTVTANQGTSPWVVSGTVAATQSGTWNINNVTGTVSLPTGAATAALQTQPGVDIGDVTVNNGAGAAAVNIQDGGNSITVDGTVAATQSGTWTVQPGNTANTTPWLVENRAATLATYSAAITNLNAALTPTDIFTITGSNTKTVKLMYIEFTATETTSAIKDVVLIKRSAANTGGTSSAVTAVPNDSANAAATATVLAYTANPTLGTSVGPVRTRNVDFEATNLVGASDQIVWTFGDKTQPIVLRGTNEVLAVNLNGVTSAGNSIDIAIEWTEQ